MGEAKYEKMNARLALLYSCNDFLRDSVMGSKIVLHHGAIFEFHLGMRNFCLFSRCTTELLFLKHPAKLGRIVFRDTLISNIESVIIIAAHATIGEIHRACPYSLIIEHDKLIMH
ncbi:hypothetical protein HRbin36_00761 [bacterium HR36]|nr:hypothetical protein HRbin36_00761 [bacterium HR36]